jgi:hypothetical protein
MARRLTYLCVVGLALGLSGCTLSLCTGRPGTDVAALAQGLLCWGANFPAYDSPPTAAAFVFPRVVDSGATVELDGNVSYDLDGGIVRYEWDADGLDGYEIDAGDDPVVETRVFFRGTGATESRRIRLRVTDNGRQTAESGKTITINRTLVTGPTASFTVTPNPVQARSVAVFDATSSVNAAGYEWDFDGDGTFEGLQAARVEHVYTSQGTRNVTLRVRDAAGVPDTETIPVKVIDARAVAAARRRVTARLTRIRLPDGLGVLTGVRVHGRLAARGLGPLRRFRRARWTARLNLSVEGQITKLRGRAIVRFPRGGGRACARIVASRHTGAPTGRLTLLGGRGPAARLRGGGTFTFGFRGDTPRPNGRLDMRLGRKRACP